MRLETADVVIVGGGIAGASLAVLLSRSGIDVVVLERQVEYADHVKGECMLPWGVAEAERIGLYELFVEGAHAHKVPRWVPYSEMSGTTGWPPIDLGAYRDGAHALDFGHPLACSVLMEAATNEGARFSRGVGAVTFQPNGRPAVSFESDGTERRIETRLIVGADGRNSGLRKQLRIPLHVERGNHVVAGLLVSDLKTFPMDHVSVGFSDITFGLSFPRGDGWTRLYSIPPIADKGRYNGKSRTERFLEDYVMPWCPGSEELPTATPQGPCRTYSGDDSWVDQPAQEGLLLIGDAAGYTSPIVGCGLSSAMRDVRIVADLMTSSQTWTPETFAPYTEERLERMRRLRFISQTQAAMWVGPGCSQRVVAGAINTMKNPELLSIFQTANLHGPEIGPHEAYSEEVRGQILAPLN